MDAVATGSCGFASAIAEGKLRFQGRGCGLATRRVAVVCARCLLSNGRLWGIGPTQRRLKTVISGIYDKEVAIEALRACLKKGCKDCPLHGWFTCKAKLLKWCLQALEEEDHDNDAGNAT